MIHIHCSCYPFQEFYSFACIAVCDVIILLNNLFYRAVYGALKHPSDFATFLLAIFIGNLMIYCSFYIVMKVCMCQNPARLDFGPFCYVKL